MDVMLLKGYSSLFAAVAVCTLKWWIVNLLQNKDGLLDFKHRLLSRASDKIIPKNYRVETQNGKCSVWYMKII